LIDYYHFIILSIKFQRESFVNCAFFALPKVKVSAYRGHSRLGFTCDPFRITDWVWSGIASIPWVGCV